MGTAIAVVLLLVGLAMIALGVYSLWDANRKKPAPPLLFAWASSYNQGFGTAFGVIVIIAGLAIGIVGATHIG
ncbi:hypothetical protein [Hamadaea tsunoensis]|uniref:hypothetical protein n=1 Tax=Hamadaea tsunoensis TaxID=53368 RepID=UPI00042A148F|nr:hypothetical protein [Hamadaea tsunoensis]